MMKINVNVEATPQEMREFFGLPDVKPLQDEMMSAIRENMREGVSGFDPLSLTRYFLPLQMESMEAMQRTFWDAFRRSGGQDQGGQSGGSKE